MENRKYICCDLKSFYASVECVERGLDPMTTNLVVADESKTEKTICLAVSPTLKSYGIGGRARLFEVIKKVKQANNNRIKNAPDCKFSGESANDKELKKSPELAISYIAAPPRMSLYMEYSARIYNVYLKYVAPEDIHVYSIDEVFIDITSYLKVYKMTPRELAVKIIRDVLKTTGITATIGIGTNLYLAKVAMDIVAKKVPADEYGVRIAELDEMSYREKLWNHRPITDFWRVGKGYERRLKSVGLYTMGDIAKCSVGGEKDYYSEELLYKLFGVNAELLIDHAWGWEPCTIAEIKKYKPQSKSLSKGQVLSSPYNYEKTRLIIREMTELLVLELVEKKYLTNQIVLTVGYDIENLTDSGIKGKYNGEIVEDIYGRSIPKQAHGTATFDIYTSSGKKIIKETLALFDRIINKDLLVRRMTIAANNIVDEGEYKKRRTFRQLDLFTLCEEKDKEKALENERKIQDAILKIKAKYGKNAVIKGMNLQEGATSIERNQQIGGHKA